MHSAINETVFKQTFWDLKILGWDFLRYEKKGRFGSRGSVAARLETAKKLLRPVCEGRAVLELGCGTGRLAETVLAAGATHYTGYDFASSAIAEARRRVKSDRVKFEVADALTVFPSRADICVSLGFLDWLTSDEVENLRTRIAVPWHLHSFSERRDFSWEQWIHRAYVHLNYGWRNTKYVPKYFSAAWIKKALALPSATVHRDPALKFGAFIHNLDSVTSP